MRRHPFLFTLWLALIVGLVAAGATLAVDGLDFAGQYETSHEVESGEDVTLTFEAEIFNYSGRDIWGATVRLEHPDDPEDPCATWSAVDLADNDRVWLSAEVILPLREREAWYAGAMPVLSVEYQDADGQTYRSRVELVFGPVIDEEGQP